MKLERNSSAIAHLAFTTTFSPFPGLMIQSRCDDQNWDLDGIRKLNNARVTDR